MFDCDFHLYEGADAFTRYLPEEYKGLVRLAEVDGRTKMIIRGRVSDYIPNPTFEVVAEPGSAASTSGTRTPRARATARSSRPMRAIPEFTDPDARLALMDRMHIDVHRELPDPRLASSRSTSWTTRSATQVLIHAFNQWLHDEWGFDHASRIFTTPVMNLVRPPRARSPSSSGRSSVARRPSSSDRARSPASGARSRRSSPTATRSGRAVEEAGIPVMLHASDSGYQRFANEWSGTGRREMRPFEQDVFGHVSQNHRPIMDTIFSAVCHGMLSRFPGVRLGSIENGGVWMTPVVEDLIDGYGKMPHLLRRSTRSTSSAGRSTWPRTGRSRSSR